MRNLGMALIFLMPFVLNCGDEITCGEGTSNVDAVCVVDALNDDTAVTCDTSENFNAGGGCDVTWAECSDAKVYATSCNENESPRCVCIINGVRSDSSSDDYGICSTNEGIARSNANVFCGWNLQ